MANVWNKYANTAARKHGKPGRDVRPKSLTLDMHAHVAVPRVAEIVTPHLKQATDPLVADSTPETQALMAKQAADIRTRMSTTDERFAVMDEMGVDMQLICPTPPQIYYYLPVDVGVQAARALNDGIAEYVGKHKDRLVALGGVPMQDGNEAARELERGMKQLGFIGVEILTNVNGKELSDPAFAPFWAKAEALTRVPRSAAETKAGFMGPIDSSAPLPCKAQERPTSPRSRAISPASELTSARPGLDGGVRETR